MKSISLEFVTSIDEKPKGYSAYVVWVPKPENKKAGRANLRTVAPWGNKFARLAFGHKFAFKPGTLAAGELVPGVKGVVAVPPKSPRAFDSLESARKIVEAIKEPNPRSILIDLRSVPEASPRLVDHFVSAVIAASYLPPKYGKAPAAKDAFAPKLVFLAPPRGNLDKIAQRALQTTERTNLVRTLAQRATNDLTPKTYVKLATDLAKKARLKSEFFSFDRLKKMGAGAFIAVAQGSEHTDAGILKISYTPKRTAKRIAIVGKGITFDTGGNNLKTGSYMFGMNGDMAGSAVALALVLLAAEMEWPITVEAYLAISENILGARAYRPNDVVTSLKGKTIEVIDTDAEGRMVLADALFLASSSKPDLVLDFATLTGSCIRALGTAYSGGYSNRRNLLGKVRKAGVVSGERVWPFPLDADFGRCLKSDFADIKQCRVTGGVDHIEAAYFLSQFVAPKVPWIHIDLAATSPEESLAHIPTKPSGFGLRFTQALLQGLGYLDA